MLLEVVHGLLILLWVRVVVLVLSFTYLLFSKNLKSEN